MTDATAPWSAKPPAQWPACPRCQAVLAPGQEWCLECGFAAATRIVAPPSWRVPAAIALVAAALAIGGIVAALVELL